MPDRLILVDLKHPRGRITAIVFPSHAALHVSQLMALRAQSITGAAGPGGKDVGTCLAVCAHNKAGGGEAGICAFGDGSTCIEFDATHPAVGLPVVTDLPPARNMGYRRHPVD